MALQISTTYLNIELPEAYCRAERFAFGNKTSCRAKIEIYSNQIAAETVPVSPLYVLSVDFEYDFNSIDSLHTQAYNAAKLLPEFENAIDV